MALVLKLCLLQCILFESLLASKGDRCNVFAFDRLKPCGVGCNEAGRFCYCPSEDFKQWEKAQAECIKIDSWLADFREMSDWYDFARANDDSRVMGGGSDFWIGAQRFDGIWYWMYPNKTEMVKWWGDNSHWEAYHGNDSTFDCATMYYRFWTNKPCLFEKKYACQKEGKTAYTKEIDLHTIMSEETGLYHFVAGDKAFINCQARSLSGLKMVIETPDFGNATFETGVNTIPTQKIYIQDVRSTVYYEWEHQRCLQYHILRLKIMMSVRVDQAVVTCTHKDSTFDEYKRSLMLEVEDGPLDPYIEISGTKLYHGRRIATVAQEVTYFCQAWPGNFGVMTVVVRKEDSLWAMTVDKGGAMKVVRDEISWDNERRYITSSGYDYGTFINLTVKFVYAHLLNEASIGCYSYDITENGTIYSIPSKQDHLSVWIDFGLANQAIVPKLEIKLYEKVIKGKRAIANCESFIVTCTGIGADVNTLSFKIESEGKTYDWKPGYFTDITTWAEIKEVAESRDKIYGPSLTIIAILDAMPEMKNARLVCEGNVKDVITSDSRELNLKTVLKPLPPVLTSDRHADKNSSSFVTLNCTSGLGEGHGQSWEVSDDKGRVNKVTVHKDGSVSGITLPWLKITLLQANVVPECGQFITSQVKMLKISPKEFGVTFTCYSYDFSDASKYRKSELSASYVIFGGGETKDDYEIYKDEAEMISYIFWLFALVLISLAATAASYWFRKLRKTEEQKPSTASGPESSKHEGSVAETETDTNVAWYNDVLHENAEDRKSSVSDQASLKSKKSVVTELTTKSTSKTKFDTTRQSD